MRAVWPIQRCQMKNPHGSWHHKSIKLIIFIIQIIYHGHVGNVFFKFDLSITELQISWDVSRYHVIQQSAFQAPNFSQVFATLFILLSTLVSTDVPSCASRVTTNIFSFQRMIVRFIITERIVFVFLNISFFHNCGSCDLYCWCFIYSLIHCFLCKYTYS